MLSLIENVLHDVPRTLLLLGGRGTGRTTYAMEIAKRAVKAGISYRILFVGVHSREARSVLEAHRIMPLTSLPTRGVLTGSAEWTFAGADDINRIRGDEYDLAICDNLDLWGGNIGRWRAVEMTLPKDWDAYEDRVVPPIRLIITAQRNTASDVAEIAERRGTVTYQLGAIADWQKRLRPAA